MALVNNLPHKIEPSDKLKQGSNDNLPLNQNTLRTPQNPLNQNWLVLLLTKWTFFSF